MLQLHDFMGVTGTQNFLTFVTGHFLKIIEWPWIEFSLGSSFNC